MDDKIYQAFDRIKAEEKLKKDTLHFLEQQRVLQQRKNKVQRWVVAAVACLCIIVTGRTSYTYFAPDAYVDVDINPSIGLTLNRYGRIIDTTAYNEDGLKIISEYNFKHSSYENGLTLLLEIFEQEGYILNQELLSITVTARTEEEKLLTSVQEHVADTVTAHHISVEQDVFFVNADVKNNATELNLSPAKYLIVLEVQEVDPSMTIERCRNHSINELREYVNEHGMCHSWEDYESELDDGLAESYQYRNHGCGKHRNGN